MERNDFESIKNTLDHLLIETALNTALLKTLTIGFFELADHCLDRDALANLEVESLPYLIREKRSAIKSA
ncbi:hypothetical protein JJC04_11970 [Flavobacterium covae]|nr:hypothetical protein [Flavobacterium covae]QYS90692.1 hypothetical protein JJC04_11970 [Flavobacterium covae]